MNNESPVCECGHELSGHYKHGCNEVERGPDYEQCHCEQFTDVRLDVLRAENDELKRVANLGGWYFAYMEEAVPKILRLENTIFGLTNEIARLTPTATRELPTLPGFYHYVNSTGEHWVVEVRLRKGQLSWWDGYGEEWLALNYASGYWSKEPIPEMTIPEKGETE